MADITSDSFNRSNRNINADSTDHYNGGVAKAWTVAGAGAWSILSNELRRTSTGAAEYCTVDLTSAGSLDVFATVALTALPAGGGGIGVVARMTNTSNFYLAQYVDGAGLSLAKNVAGVLTTIASIGAGFGAGDVLGLRCVSAAITLTVNGAAVIAVSDLDLTTGFLCGFRADSTDVTWRLDNFQADDVSPVPPNPYDVVVNAEAAHVQDDPTANLQWMADLHGADTPCIGYPVATQYRSS